MLTGTFTALHSFSGVSTDGNYPQAALTAVGSALFGTTAQGGGYSDGTIYSINPNGSGFQLLHSFTDSTT